MTRQDRHRGAKHQKDRTYNTATEAVVNDPIPLKQLPDDCTCSPQTERICTAHPDRAVDGTELGQTAAEGDPSGAKHPGHRRGESCDPRGWF